MKPITLPVLDAFFADNSFAETLKTRLKLNDDEVTKLKELARSETAKLDESELEKREGSVRALTRTRKRKSRQSSARKSQNNLRPWLMSSGAVKTRPTKPPVMEPAK